MDDSPGGVGRMIDWEALRAAWERDEIRRGKDVQMSLLTASQIGDTLCERLSSDRGTTIPSESFQPQGRTASGEGGSSRPPDKE